MIHRASVFILIIASTCISSVAQAQGCSDPPVTNAGTCLKQAGARCDPASRRWIGGSNARYFACMEAANEVVNVRDVHGRSHTLRMTGRYSDCIRDNLRLGHSQERARAWCDGRPTLR